MVYIIEHYFTDGFRHSQGKPFRVDTNVHHVVWWLFKWRKTLTWPSQIVNEFKFHICINNLICDVMGINTRYKLTRVVDDWQLKEKTQMVPDGNLLQTVRGWLLQGCRTGLLGHQCPLYITWINNNLIIGFNLKGLQNSLFISAYAL